MKDYTPDLQAQYNRCKQVRDGYPVDHGERKKITIQMEELKHRIEKGE